MKEKKDKKDIIIKIILIIIITLLLIHNCALLKKKGKDKVPSGNVNIIEITCEDNDKCDIKEEKNTKSSDSNVENIVTNDKTVQKNKENRETKKENKSETQKSPTNSNQTQQEERTPTEEDQDDDTVVEPENELFVRDSKLVWDDTSQLKIFTNSVYTFEDKIAPEMENTYQFVVKNSTSYNIKYTIDFIENNPHNINMKYKLKKNNSYLVDHYVSFNELNITKQLLNSKTNDTYYLEWKWISSDNDTEVGNIAASYSLKIDVKAESTNE